MTTIWAPQIPDNWTTLSEDYPQGLFWDRRGGVALQGNDMVKHFEWYWRNDYGTKNYTGTGLPDLLGIQWNTRWNLHKDKSILWEVYERGGNYTDFYPGAGWGGSIAVGEPHYLAAKYHTTAKSIIPGKPKNQKEALIVSTNEYDGKAFWPPASGCVYPSQITYLKGTSIDTQYRDDQWLIVGCIRGAKKGHWRLVAIYDPFWLEGHDKGGDAVSSDPVWNFAAVPLPNTKYTIPNYYWVPVVQTQETEAFRYCTSGDKFDIKGLEGKTKYEVFPDMEKGTNKITGWRYPKRVEDSSPFAGHTVNEVFPHNNSQAKKDLSDAVIVNGTTFIYLAQYVTEHRDPKWSAEKYYRKTWNELMSYMQQAYPGGYPIFFKVKDDPNKDNVYAIKYAVGKGDGGGTQENGYYVFKAMDKDPIMQVTDTTTITWPPKLKKIEYDTHDQSWWDKEFDKLEMWMLQNDYSKNFPLYWGGLTATAIFASVAYGDTLAVFASVVASSIGFFLPYLNKKIRNIIFPWFYWKIASPVEHMEFEAWYTKIWAEDKATKDIELVRRILIGGSAIMGFTLVSLGIFGGLAAVIKYIPGINQYYLPLLIAGGAVTVVGDIILGIGTATWAVMGSLQPSQINLGFTDIFKGVLGVKFT